MRKFLASLTMLALLAAPLNAAYIGNKDFYLEQLQGNIPGHAEVIIAGHQDSAGTSRVTVHPGSTDEIDQSSIWRTHGTPATVKVSSTDADDVDTSGSGMQECLLLGLDANGDLQQETILMNGQTEVTSSNTYSAVLNVIGTDWGASAYNEGTIWVGTGTVTSGVPATKFLSVEAQHNKSLTSFYVVPNNKTLYLRSLILCVGTANKDVEFFVETTSNGGVAWITVAEFGMGEDIWQGFPNMIPGQSENVGLRIRSESSGAGTNVTAIMGGILIDD